VYFSDPVGAVFSPRHFIYCLISGCDPNAGRVFDWQLFEKFLFARPRGFAFDPVTVAGTRAAVAAIGVFCVSSATCSSVSFIRTRCRHATLYSR
jgi:hypothetical protein